MSPKKNKAPRSQVMFKCEGELLQVFGKHGITVPEAVFLMERIKFLALYNEMMMSLSKSKETPQPQATTSNMFR